MATFTRPFVFFMCLMTPTIFAASPVHANSLETRDQPIGKSGQNVCTASEKGPEPNLRCGYQGYLKHPVAHSTTTGLTYEQCRDLCLVSPYEHKSQGTQPCVVFSYDSSNQTCAQYPKNINFQHGRKSKSGVKFWNRHCFEATYYKTFPVYNSGFDEDGGSFDHWGPYWKNQTQGDTLTIVRPGLDSRYAAQINIHADPDAEQGNYVVLPPNQPGPVLCGGVQYTYEWSYFQVPGGTVYSEGNYPALYSYLNQPSGDEVYSFSVDFDSTQSYTSDGETNSAGYWYTFSQVFTADSSGTAYVNIEVDTSQGTSTVVKVDEVRIYVTE